MNESIWVIEYRRKENAASGIWLIEQPFAYEGEEEAEAISRTLANLYPARQYRVTEYIPRPRP
jgi:hypothetical protein